MRTVLWQSLTTPSFERFVMSPDPKGFHLGGTVVMAGAAGPTEIRYSILTTPDWRARLVGLHVQSPSGNKRMALESDGAGHWISGGNPVPEAEGALDVDLSFTPSTNTLPINRLSPALGERHEVDVLYIDPFEDGLKMAAQSYERLDAHRYRYRSGAFTCEIGVDAEGLVAEYPGTFTVVTRS